MRDTIIQENGKVMTDEDLDASNPFYHLPLDFYDVKAARPLRLKKKLYEFFNAPITKFWAHSVSILMRMPLSCLCLAKLIYQFFSWLISSSSCSSVT